MDNYKLAFIHGRSNSERKIYEGNIDKYGELGDGNLHILCLLDYAKEKYPDVPIFKQFNDKYAATTVGFVYTMLGDVVFFNTTTNISKYGKTGIFMLPDNITDKQKEAMYALANSINDYSVNIYYDLKLEDGILDGSNFSLTEKSSPTQLLDCYFNRNNSEIKKK